MNKKEFPSEDIQNALISDYQQGFNITELKYKYETAGVGWNMIPKILEKFNIKRHRVRYKWNTRFFKSCSIKTAYWAGFIMADGCLQPRNTSKNTWTIIIKINIRDLEHLKEFCEAINLDTAAIKTYRGDQVCTRVSCTTDHRLALIQISRSNLNEDLLRFGIIRNKTYNFVAPDIPKSVLPHYLRGWIDGDGSINTRNNDERIKVTGNCEALEWFKNTVLSLGYTGKFLFYKNGIYGDLLFCGKENVLQLAELLQYKASPRMKRKWDKVSILKQTHQFKKDKAAILRSTAKQRYNLKKQEWERNKLATDPVYKEKRLINRRKRAKIYANKHPERVKASKRAWYLKNRERILERLKNI